MARRIKLRKRLSRTAEPSPPGGKGVKQDNLGAKERAELAVIEDRLTTLRRRYIAEERLSPSGLIMDTLGPRPTDPLKVPHWNDGVEAIYEFHQRHGINSTTGHPLGPPSRDPVRSAERRQAELRLERAQRRIGIERAGAERDIQLDV